jgi:hypothetical protein
VAAAAAVRRLKGVVVEDAGARRRAWIVRGLILLVGLVAAVVVYAARGPSCAEWQGDYEEVAIDGVFTFIGVGPNSDRINEVKAERPEGCPFP